MTSVTQSGSLRSGARMRPLFSAMFLFLGLFLMAQGASAHILIDPEFDLAPRESGAPVVVYASPNPASGTITLHLQENVTLSGITIRDIDGALVFQSSYNEEPWSVSAMTPGSYFLLVSTSAGEVALTVTVVE